MDFSLYMSPTKNEMAIRANLAAKIRACVNKYYPYAVVQVFGSSSAGLYLPDADLDICVHDPTPTLNPRDYSAMRLFADRLRTSGILESRSLNLILKARVPIVKFRDVTTHIQVDVSFDNGRGAEAVEYCQKALKLQPALYPLCMIVKYFLKIKDLSRVNEGGLGSYSVLLLFISFLDHHPKVASGQIRPMDNLGVLLIEFFEFYGKKFQNEAVGIDVKPKTYFDRFDPEYAYRIRSGGHIPLVLIDPLDPDNIVSRASHQYSKVRSAFTTAYHTMTTRMFALKRYTSGKSKIPPDERHDGATILGTIMHVYWHLLEFRGHLEEVSRTRNYSDTEMNPNGGRRVAQPSQTSNRGSHIRYDQNSVVTMTTARPVNTINSVQSHPGPAFDLEVIAADDHNESALEEESRTKAAGQIVL